MFGYVRPPIQTLSREEAERFRQMYCGLCHTLGKRYGTVARFVLKYDFTYLAILLSESQEHTIHRKRCVVHPVHPHRFFEETPALQLAADESVILAYWQLRDGVEDHDWFSGMKYRGMSTLLETAYQKAAAIRPTFDKTVRQQLTLLRKLEEEKCSSIDRPADTFAVLLKSAAEEVDDPVRKRVLEQIFYHLGRWIYLVDAADDMKKDAKEGNYNPVSLRFQLKDGIWTPESRREFAATLDHSIHMITTAFELWDFNVWTPILEQTFYTGLFHIGKSVLDGTFHTMPHSEHRKKRKNVEETT